MTRIRTLPGPELVQYMRNQLTAALAFSHRLNGIRAVDDHLIMKVQEYVRNANNMLGLIEVKNQQKRG